MHTETLNGWLTMFPEAEGFPLGTDAMVLADYAALPRGAAICDLCAGSGAVGLLLLSRDPSMRVTALELRQAACAAMERTAAENGIADRFSVLIDCELTPAFDPGSGCLVQNRLKFSLLLSFFA